jgi:hypothetical protein
MGIMLDIMLLGQVLFRVFRFSLVSIIPPVLHKGKGKVHPRTGHEGTEGEWSWYSSTLYITLALEGSGWSTPRPGHFTPGNDPVPIVQEAG